MRILWVKMGGLWPCTSGGRVRSLNTIAELSRRHQVTVLTTHGPADDPAGLTEHLSNCHRVISVPHAAAKQGTVPFATAMARSWASRHPVDLHRWKVPAVARQAEFLLRNGAADVCVADFLLGAVNVPLGGPVPVVLFEHNVEHLIWRRLCGLEPNPLRRVLLDLEWRKLRTLEADMCQRADLTIAVSEDDRERLAEIAPGASIVSVPTGVDVDYFAPSTGPSVPNRLVFSGSMDWPPNEDAVLHFVDVILPRIRLDLPDVSLTVVGRNPSARLREVARRAGVEVTGTVGDVREAVGEAAVVVVPLRSGGGTRLKIFEALSMAKAVVSTTVGAEGLHLDSGHHVVLADEPLDFAQAVVELLRNEERRHLLGLAGRALVAARFSWPSVATHFERYCEDVAAGTPRRRADVHGPLAAGGEIEPAARPYR